MTNQKAKVLQKSLLLEPLVFKKTETAAINQHEYDATSQNGHNQRIRLERHPVLLRIDSLSIESVSEYELFELTEISFSSQNNKPISTLGSICFCFTAFPFLL